MDVDTLAAPLSEEAPSGENLEYDPEMGELQRAAAGTPAREMGDQKTDAIPPDWKAVLAQALALFERTRDLRVAVYVANARLALDGFAGLSESLALIRLMSESLWDSVYPPLDEDDQDPFVRCNAIRELTNREVMLNNLLDTPFISARMAGKYSLRDLKILNGELSLPEDSDSSPPSMDLVEAAFREVDPEELESNQAQISRCAELVRELEAYFTSAVGAADAPDLSDLQAYLDEIDQFVRRQMAQIGVGDVQIAEESQGNDASSGGAPIAGDIRNSGDVLRMIDKICSYYAQREPSSPVPILLKRAASLVNKSFMDIVADLAPSGVSEVEVLGGNVDSYGGYSDYSEPSQQQASEGEKQEDPW